MNNLNGLSEGNSSRATAQADILMARPLRKSIGQRRIDTEIRGAETVLKALQSFALLGQIAKTYGLERTSIAFLLGVYLRHELRTKTGITPAALRSYVNGWRGNSGRQLRQAGLLQKEPSGELYLTYEGMTIVRHFISGAKYSHENYRNSLRREQTSSRNR